MSAETLGHTELKKDNNLKPVANCIRDSPQYIYRPTKKALTFTSKTYHVSTPDKNQHEILTLAEHITPRSWHPTQGIRVC